MPNDEFMVKLLYSIIKQLDLKGIDWTKVSSDLEITNGHAARMRYSRFRSQMEGHQPRPRARRTNPDSSVPGSAKREKKVKRQKVEDNDDVEQFVKQEKLAKIKTENEDASDASPAGFGFSLGAGINEEEPISPRTVPGTLPAHGQNQVQQIQTPATTPASTSVSGVVAFKSEPREDDEFAFATVAPEIDTDPDVDADADADLDFDTDLHLPRGVGMILSGAENIDLSPYGSQHNHSQQQHLHSQNHSLQHMNLSSSPHHHQQQQHNQHSYPLSQHSHQHPHQQHLHPLHTNFTTPHQLNNNNNLNTSFLSATSGATTSSSQGTTADLFSSFHDSFEMSGGLGNDSLSMGGYLGLFDGGHEQHLGFGDHGGGHGQVKTENGGWNDAYSR